MTWANIETISVVLLNTIIAFCYGHIAGISFVTGWLVCVLFGTFKRHEEKQAKQEKQAVRIEHNDLHI